MRYHCSKLLSDLANVAWWIHAYVTLPHMTLLLTVSYAITYCSRGGFHGRQWTAVYIGSLAARMTMTKDGGGWNRRRAGCSRKDTVAPDHAGIGKRAHPTWNQCVPETLTSEGLAALVWHAPTEKIDVSVWQPWWLTTLLILHYYWLSVLPWWLTIRVIIIDA